MDLDLALPIVFLMFATAGVVYTIVGIGLFLRFERDAPEVNIHVAIAALLTGYILWFAFSYLQNYVLVPEMLLFLMTVALLVTIWLGSRARSKTGTRIAVAGACTLAALAFRIGIDIYRLHKII